MHHDLIEPAADRSHASGQVSFAGRPNAAGCLPPISAANASLYRATSSGPQWITIGKPDSRHLCTIVRSTGDHDPTGPSGVAAHSIARINSRTCPGPSNTPHPDPMTPSTRPPFHAQQRTALSGDSRHNASAACAELDPCVLVRPRVDVATGPSRPARRLRPERPLAAIQTNQANGPSSG